MMKIALLTCIALAACAPIGLDTSQVEEGLCTVEDQPDCPDSAWQLQHTADYGHWYVGIHYSGVSYSDGGGYCTDVGGGDQQCRWHITVGGVECTFGCDYESDINGNIIHATCWSNCH